MCQRNCRDALFAFTLILWTLLFPATAHSQGYRQAVLCDTLDQMIEFVTIWGEGISPEESARAVNSNTKSDVCGVLVFRGVFVANEWHKPVGSHVVSIKKYHVTSILVRAPWGYVSHPVDIMQYAALLIPSLDL